MKKSLQLLLGAAAVTTVSAAGDSPFGCELTNAPGCKEKYDYKKNGSDWPKLVYTDAAGKDVNECKGTVPQSPIDLKNSWPTVSNLAD